VAAAEFASVPKTIILDRLVDLLSHNFMLNAPLVDPLRTRVGSVCQVVQAERRALE
jgi:hypothetical protein